MTTKLETLGPLADALKEVQEHDAHVILEHEGEPVAALVSLRDLKLLDEYIEALEDAIDRIEIDKALAEGGEPVLFEDVCCKLGL